jgi:hypothetical protein
MRDLSVGFVVLSVSSLDLSVTFGHISVSLLNTFPIKTKKPLILDQRLPFKKQGVF